MALPKIKPFHVWIEERDRMLRDLDVDSPQCAAVAPEVRLMALHKARYECTNMEPELRHASRHWLQERGLRRLFNLEFSDDNSLPM